MGAGFFPAGGYAGGPPERAGVDLAYVPTPLVKVVTPAAIQFDPRIRGFTQNPDGSLVAVHPVDQWVVLVLWLGQGNVPSVPDLGNRIRARIRRVAPSMVKPIVVDEVTTTLRPRIDAGDIELVNQPGLGGAIDVTTGSGRTTYAVYYRNLRLDPNRQANATRAAGGF